ncbi:MAG TPA: hypothetical protein VKX24_05400, partial [Acidimicrobiia bacterium]|nr:hypothetical protein [Acidimicrobiia bacterium]
AVGIDYGRLLPTVPGFGEAWRAVGTTARQVRQGGADPRALARAARSTRESVVPWLRSRRWGAAGSALGAATRAEAAYRRLTLAGRGRR